MFNYRDFSNGIKLQNLSQEIALQGKRAQILASQGRFPILSQSQINNGIANFIPTDWVSSYGLAFRLSDPKSFVFYFNSPYHYDADYDPTESNFNALAQSRNLYLWDFFTGGVTCGTQESECMEEIRITDGSVIDMICFGSEPQSDPNCTTGVLGDINSELYISFTRPFLDAYILNESLVSQSNVFIRVSSPDGDQHRYVTFWSTGQIAVN